MEIFDRLSGFGVVPVIALDDPAAALPLADALADGGLPVAEITFRTPAARDAIAEIARHRPDMLVGAGTVIEAGQVDAAREAGAAFALAPGTNTTILAHAAAAGLPFAPGVMTPSELEAAIAAGCAMVKFFPAMQAGGPGMLKAMAGPYAHTGVGFNPTGGVTLDNLGDWLALSEVRAVGGTWIARREDIAAGHFERIAENARAATERVRRVRGA